MSEMKYIYNIYMFASQIKTMEPCFLSLADAALETFWLVTLSNTS